MSNYVCPECGANYIDWGHNKPAVLAQDIEIAQLKDLLKEIRSKIKTVYDMDYRKFITSALFDDAFVKKIDEVLK